MGVAHLVFVMARRVLVVGMLLDILPMTALLHVHFTYTPKEKSYTCAQHDAYASSSKFTITDVTRPYIPLRPTPSSRIDYHAAAHPA